MAKLIKIRVSRNKHRKEGVCYKESKTDFLLIRLMISYFVFVRIMSGRKGWESKTNLQWDFQISEYNNDDDSRGCLFVRSNSPERREVGWMSRRSNSNYGSWSNEFLDQWFPKDNRLCTREKKKSSVESIWFPDNAETIRIQGWVNSVEQLFIWDFVVKDATNNVPSNKG